MYGRLTELGAEPLAITIDPQRTGALLGAAGVEHHRIRDTPGLIRALRSVDGVVFGGGGLVQDETGPLNLPFHLGRLALGRVLRKPWVGVGLGVGTVSRRTGRQLVRRVMSGAQAITVRDPASQQRLLALGVESVLAADPVVAWPEAEEPPGTDDVLAVSVRRPNLPGQRTLSSAPPLDEEWLGRMSGAIEAVAIDLGLGVRFVAFEADQDGDLHRRLAERIAVESELVSRPSTRSWAPSGGPAQVHHALPRRSRRCGVAAQPSWSTTRLRWPTSRSIWPRRCLRSGRTA